MQEWKIPGKHDKEDDSKAPDVSLVRVESAHQNFWAAIGHRPKPISAYLSSQQYFRQAKVDVLRSYISFFEFKHNIFQFDISMCHTHRVNVEQASSKGPKNQTSCILTSRTHFYVLGQVDAIYVFLYNINSVLVFEIVN